MSTQSYYDLSAQTLRGLDEARERFSEMLRKTPRPTPGERAQIQIEIAQIDAHWQKVYQETLAVSQQALTVKPPSAGDLEQAKRLADALDKLTAEANTLSAVVSAVTQIMTIWKKTA
jgi:hypothetical protein